MWCSVLLAALVFVGERGTGIAQGQRGESLCGDRICTSSETCATCRTDCGVCSAEQKCGDGRCYLRGSENALTCPEDCPHQGGGLSVVEKTCGDGVCSLEEDCSVCAADCGACSPSFLSRLRAWLRGALRLAMRLLRDGSIVLTERGRLILQGTLANVTEQRRLLGQHALERSEAAQELLQFLAEHQDVQRQLSALDTRLIERMSDRGRASVLTALPALYLRLKLARGTVAGRRSMQELTKKMAKDPETRQLIGALPTSAAIVQAAEQGDLAALTGLLPASSPKDLPSLVSELRMLEDLLGFAAPGTKRTSLLMRVHAQETAGAESIAGPQDALRDSLALAEHLRAIAPRDPDATSSLEEQIANLQKRRATLAGILHIEEEAVTANLNRAGAGAHDRSTKSFLSLVGIFRYLHSTANFQALEREFTDALSRMHSGMQRIRSFFARGVSPQAEAAAILINGGESGIVTALNGENIEAQRASLRALARDAEDRLQPLLRTLEEGKRREFTDRIALFESSRLNTAANEEEFRAALGELDGIIRDAQTAARARKNFFFRTVYALQDFFGMHPR